jgi:SAM-dependent methyltransferase
MSRYRWVVLCVATLALCGTAFADDYIDGLKERCHTYRQMTGRFAPIYEPLAQQMVDDYGLKDGAALEIGGGIGTFAIALAKKTNMTVYALDIDPLACRLCGYFADEAGMTGRVIPVEGDAQKMPLKSNLVDFIFSRGCIPFVPDQVAFLRECRRVLRPGGVAYVGHGGFGRLLPPETRAELVKWRLSSFETHKPEGWNGPGDRFPELAAKAHLKHYRLIKEPDVGWWLEFRK